jgi:hypothetical protein
MFLKVGTVVARGAGVSVGTGVALGTGVANGLGVLVGAVGVGRATATVGSGVGGALA